MNSSNGYADRNERIGVLPMMEEMDLQYIVELNYNNNNEVKHRDVQKIL